MFAKVKDALAGKKPADGTKQIKAISFNDVKSLNRPAPAWRWNLILPPVQSSSAPKEEGPKNPILKTLSKLLSAAPDSQIILCENIDILPNITTSTQDRYYNGRMTTFPGLPSMPSVSAVFYESEDYATTDYFRKWQYEVYNPDTKVYGLPANYGRDIEFLALPVTDNEDLPRYMSIILKKSWPAEIGKLSYGHSTERIKVQVQFAFLDQEVSIVAGPPSDGKTDAASLVNKVTQWKS
jgi:hypothetical protein